jgi:hypothetical protein
MAVHDGERRFPASSGCSDVETRASRPLCKRCIALAQAAAQAHCTSANCAKSPTAPRTTGTKTGCVGMPVVIAPVVMASKRSATFARRDDSANDAHDVPGGR